MIDNYIWQMSAKFSSKPVVEYQTTLKQKPFKAVCKYHLERSHSQYRDVWSYIYTLQANDSDHMKACDTLLSREGKYFSPESFRHNVINETLLSKQYKILVPKSMEYFELLKKYNDKNIRYLLKKPHDGKYHFSLVIDVCGYSDRSQFQKKFEQLFMFFDKKEQSDEHKFSATAVNSYRYQTYQQSFTLHLSDDSVIPMLMPFFNGPFNLRRTEQYLGEL